MFLEIRLFSREISQLKAHLKDNTNIKAKLKKEKDSNDWKIEEIYLKIEPPEPIEMEEEPDDLIKDENGNSQDQNQNELRAECGNNLENLSLETPSTANEGNPLIDGLIDGALKADPAITKVNIARSPLKVIPEIQDEKSRVEIAEVFELGAETILQTTENNNEIINDPAQNAQLPDLEGEISDSETPYELIITPIKPKKPENEDEDEPIKLKYFVGTTGKYVEPPPLAHTKKSNENLVNNAEKSLLHEIEGELQNKLTEDGDNAKENVVKETIVLTEQDIEDAVGDLTVNGTIVEDKTIIEDCDQKIATNYEVKVEPTKIELLNAVKIQDQVEEVIIDPPGDFGDTPNTMKSGEASPKHVFSSFELRQYTDRVIQYTLVELSRDDFITTYVGKRFYEEESSRFTRK